MIEIPGEMIIEGVARAFSQYLEGRPELGEKLLGRMAELRCELMTPEETAAMLSLTKDVLRKNWRQYGLTKSTALGPNEPRFFRSQVVAACQREGKVIHGQTPREAKTQESLAAKVTPFPRRTAPTLSPAPANAG